MFFTVLTTQEISRTNNFLRDLLLMKCLRHMISATVTLQVKHIIVMEKIEVDINYYSNIVCSVNLHH